MPTYEYKCAACSHTFEQFQSMKDAPLRKCPKCGKAKLERLIGIGAAVIFKGSGFYQTDYRSDSYKKAAEADKPAAAPAADAAKSEPAKAEQTPKTEQPKAEPAKSEPVKADAPAKRATDGAAKGSGKKKAKK